LRTRGEERLTRREQVLRRDLAVEDVADARIRGDQVLGSLDRELIRHDERYAGPRELALGRESPLGIRGPPHVCGGLLAARELLLHLDVLLVLVEVVLDDLQVVALLLRFGLGADLPLRKGVVAA